jgi:sugar phosphate isomerase/epimerase
MLSLSTSWKSARAETEKDILMPIRNIGIRAIELDYRVPEEIFQQMLPALRRNEPAVTSIHNFFPVPAILRRDQGSGDAFLLSSQEKEDRERAVKFTLRTLEFAHETNASAVVLHLGFTEMDDEFEQLKRERGRGRLSDQKSHVFELIKERRRISGKYLDAALFSLDKLWRPAERLSLKLGIENRNTLREVPDSEELDSIFASFEGAPFGYWHDVGHAAAQELLYGIDHEELLAKFAGRLIGIHLHDAEAGKDHKAPGQGKVDFDMVKKYVAPSVLRVLEVHSGVSERELREGIAFLMEHGLAIKGEIVE